MTVTNSNGAIINWNTFNIAAGETTRFIQSSSSSAVLNRVLASDPSTLYGTLLSNGKVWLINPSGIMVGPGARIDTAGFIASVLPVTNADFLAGRLNFGNSNTTSRGSVTNQGTITTPEGGNVFLIGASSVENGGLIQTPGGQTILAAGQTVQLADTAVPGVNVAITGSGSSTNLGTILADAGRVGIFGAMVRNSGSINASSVVKDGGRIFLKATKQLTLTDSSRIEANSAMGNGGFVETSGDVVKIADNARVSTTAPHGKTGTWWVDPLDFTVAASGGDITGAALSASLGITNVTLQSSSGGTAGSGNVNINAAVSWGANTVLTLTASNNVNVNANISATGATAGIAINPKTANGTEAASGTGTFNLGSGASINLPNVSSSSTTAFVLSGTPYTVINSLGAPGSITGTDLQGISGNLHLHYALGSNIDARATTTWNSNAGFLPIGVIPMTGYHDAFVGTFNGLGHTISNLVINRPSTDYVGLFWATGSGGVIRNVGITGQSIGGSLQVGGLVGSLQPFSSLSDSYTTGSVVGVGGVGGLVGESYGNINNSFSTSTVRGDGVGGLVGWNSGTITNSHASGNVVGFNSNAGGLVGTNSGNINISYAVAVVSGGVNVGGLVGQNGGISAAGGSITNSFSNSLVNGINDVGGLVGSNYQASITNTYATGSVVGVQRVGGLVGTNFGFNLTPGTISSSYSTALVSGNASFGGLVGLNNGALNASYWNVDSSGQASGVGFGSQTGTTGLTAAQMQQQSSISGFDFINIWRIYQGHTAPLLKSFLIPLTVANVTKTYDGLTWSGTSGLTFSDPNATTSPNLLGATTPFGNAKNVGSYSLNLWSNQQGYDITSIGNLTVTPAPLTIKPNDYSRSYNATAFSGGTGLGFTGFVSGENASFLTDHRVISGSSQGAINAGTYAVNVAGFASTNYAISYASGQLVITPATLTASIAGTTRKLYDATTTATIANASYRLTGFFGTDAASINQTTGTYNSANVASANAVTANLTGGNFTASGGTLLSNYLLPTSASGAASITPRTLNASISGTTSKVYDGTLTATLSNGNYLLSGFVGAESATLNQTVGQFNSRNVAVASSVTATLAPGNYVAVGGTLLSNYVLPTTVSGGGVITPAPLTIKPNDYSRSYNATAFSGGTGLGFTGFVSGENASFLTDHRVISGSSQGAINAGTYAVNVAGFASTNYAISYASGQLVITPATLRYMANPATVTVGLTFPTFSGSVTGFLGADTLALATTGTASWLTSATPLSPAGQYAITGSGLTANKNNYIFVQAPTNANALTIH